MADSVSFDLSTISVEESRKLRPFRGMWLVIGGVFGVMAAWFVLLAITPGDFRDITQRVVVVGVESGSLFIAGLCAYAYWKTGPGAIALSIGDEGIRFIWKSGRPDLIEWNDVSTGFDLLDYSSNLFLAQHSSNLWEIRRWNRPPTTVSREAFEALLGAASQRGISIEAKPHPNSFLGWAECRELRLTSRPH
jgi:hypothetical protein